MFCLGENTNTGFISLLDTNSPVLISKSIASELIKKLDIFISIYKDLNLFGHCNTEGAIKNAQSRETGNIG
jgi:hypothetical protein